MSAAAALLAAALACAAGPEALSRMPATAAIVSEIVEHLALVGRVHKEGISR